MEETKQDIFSFITSEEAAYLLPVEVSSGNEWSMAQHIKLTLLYKSSKYERGNQDDKPFMNIMRPILNLQHRSEGFDVKDIVLYVNSAKDYYKSFLIKKYHNKWARDNSIDTFIDDMVESYVDFGGALVKNVHDVKPEVVPLQRLAFCDQTDILSGPICEKHPYAPDQLKEMAKHGWGDEKKGATITIDDLILLAETAKKNKQSGQQTKTPGKYIEIYELHGMFPEWWLGDEYDQDENKYTRQLHIVAFYQPTEGDKKGVHLYKGKEGDSIYDFIARDKIYGRALGFGGGEELFEPQVWTNYDAIRIKDMLDAASKILFQTTDPGFAKRSKMKNLDNLEILTTEEGKRIDRINTTPVNIKFFNDSIMQWEALAKTTGGADDAAQGKTPPSGTSGRLQELVVITGQGSHEYRKGKLATFLGEIYRKQIIPHIAKKINQGQEFITEIDLDELQGVADSVVTNEANKLIKEKILNGEVIEKEAVETYKQQIREQFMKGGNKRFLKILKEEIKDAPLDVFINIVGKQAKLEKMTNDFIGVLRDMMSTYDPQTKTFVVFDDPRMSKLFNQIIEYFGLSPIDFYQAPKPQQLAPQPAGQPVVAQPGKENLARVLK